MVQKFTDTLRHMPMNVSSSGALIKQISFSVSSNMN